MNIAMLTDSYKMSHWKMYPKGTTNVYSYFESRNGATYNKTVFFGLQYLLMKYLEGSVVDSWDLTNAEEFCGYHFGDTSVFNKEMWEHIVREHDGRLPVRIMAVPEGTPVGVNNVLMTIENTDPKCAALTNHLETLLSQVWAPSTVATLSYEVRKMLQHYANETGGNDGVAFGLHDFGYRGVSSVESAGICGAGHLLNFLGTDTIHAMAIARSFYGADYEGLAYSVPASEHSVMTSMGADGEEAVFKHLLDTFPKGILSVVIDSYNYKEFISTIARKYKDQILAREGKVVFRPDSGDPSTVTLDVLKRLSDVFGVTANGKGYRVLNPKVGMLWGDGIDYMGIRSILYTMKNNDYASSNIVFGMGGGLLQKINRDTQRFAFKSSAQMRDGIWVDVQKNPLDASKASKRGRLGLIKEANGNYSTVAESAVGNDNALRLVFENGKLFNVTTFTEARKNTGNW